MLIVDGISKAFGETLALRGVDLALRPGEVHGLVGENGAGKSTLIKCLAGVHEPDIGGFRLDGEPLVISGPRAAERAGFRFIHQELNLVPYFDAVENVFIGRPYPRRAGLLDRAAMEGQVAEVARLLAPDLPLRRVVSELTIGQRQMVEVLRAFLTRGRFVVMDEPTAALTDRECRRLHEAIAHLRARGAAILYVSHRLEEVLALCDTVTVMRDGEVVRRGPTAGTSPEDLVRAMSGGKAIAAARARPPRVVADAPPLLEIGAGGLTLGVRRGEIVGLYGLMGAGRSRMLRAVYGRDPAPDLAIAFDGRPHAPRHPRAAIAKGIAYVPEDRRSQGLVLQHSVRRNLTLPLLALFRRHVWPGPSRAAELRFAQDVKARLGVRMGEAEAPISSLSGGNQQKILVGRWFARKNALYLLDEPTRGIDLGAKADLHERVRELAREGAAIVFATSDLAEIFQLGDRVAVVRDGGFAAIRDVTSVTPEDVLAVCYGRAA